MAAQCFLPPPKKIQGAEVFKSLFFRTKMEFPRWLCRAYGSLQSQASQADKRASNEAVKHSWNNATKLTKLRFPFWTQSTLVGCITDERQASIYIWTPEFKTDILGGKTDIDLNFLNFFVPHTCEKIKIFSINCTL